MLNHSLHAAIQDVKVRLIGQLQQVCELMSTHISASCKTGQTLDYFADLRSNCSLDRLVRGDHLCQGQCGMHAHRQVRVVESLRHSTEDFAEALMNPSLDAFHRERA